MQDLGNQQYIVSGWSTKTRLLSMHSPPKAVQTREESQYHVSGETGPVLRLTSERLGSSQDEKVNTVHHKHLQKYSAQSVLAICHL